MSFALDIEKAGFEVIRPELVDVGLQELGKPADNQVLRVRDTSLQQLRGLPAKQVPFIPKLGTFDGEFTDWHPDSMATGVHFTEQGEGTICFAGIAKTVLRHFSRSEIRAYLAGCSAERILSVDFGAGVALAFNGSYSDVAMFHKVTTTAVPRISYNLPVVRWPN